MPNFWGAVKSTVNLAFSLMFHEPVPVLSFYMQWRGLTVNQDWEAGPDIAVKSLQVAVNHNNPQASGSIIVPDHGQLPAWSVFCQFMAACLVAALCRTFLSGLSRPIPKFTTGCCFANAAFLVGRDQVRLPSFLIVAVVLEISTPPLQNLMLSMPEYEFHKLLRHPYIDFIQNGCQTLNWARKNRQFLWEQRNFSQLTTCGPLKIG